MIKEFYNDNYKSQLEIFKKTQSWIENEVMFFNTIMNNNLPQHVNRNKSQVLKITPVVIQALNIIFQDKDEQKFVDHQSIKIILELMASMLKGCKQIGLKF